MAKYILTFSILISLIIRAFLILNGKHLADVWHIARMGETFLVGQNPYLVLDFNVYPPLAVYLSALSLFINQHLSIHFHIVLKFWVNLADVIATLVIYHYLLKSKVKAINAALWSSLFILNPISIIISAAHGQLDSISSLLVIIAIFLLEFGPKNKRLIFSALSLGLSIAVKASPLILLPFFLLYKKSSLKQKISYLSLVLLPTIVTLIPFLTSDPAKILSNLLSYSGVYDFVYPAILRGIWSQINASPDLPTELINGLANASKLIFAIGGLALILLYDGRRLIKACLAIYVLFISIYSGISAQYLSWLVPLAILERDKRVIPYLVLGAVALTGFYLYFGPDVLLGKLTHEWAFQRKYVYPYVFGNLSLWIFNLWWLLSIIRNLFQNSWSNLSLLRQRLILISLGLFVLSFIPMIQVLIKFFQLYALEN